MIGWTGYEIQEIKIIQTPIMGPKNLIQVLQQEVIMSFQEILLWLGLWIPFAS